MRRAAGRSHDRSIHAIARHHLGNDAPHLLRRLDAGIALERRCRDHEGLTPALEGGRALNGQRYRIALAVGIAGSNIRARTKVSRAKPTDFPRPAGGVETTSSDYAAPA